MRRLFVLRPEPAASWTVDKARSMGLDACSIPLFELEPVEWSAPDPAGFDAILLTSANAANLAGARLEYLRALPVHAVGEATAVAARVAGLGVATVGSGGVDQLLNTVEPDCRLLHLCGEDRRSPAAPKQAITTLTVYRAKPTRAVELRALEGAVAVLHSPRASLRLAELIAPAERKAIRIAAISEATAEAAGKGWQQVPVARAPNDTELLALAARLCET
jgi:uroporphyrinogen-III synthase